VSQTRNAASNSPIPSTSAAPIAPRAEQPIAQVAEKLGIPDRYVLRYGHDKAKIDLDYLADLAPKQGAKLVLVTAISPTPAGEGKTTTSIGLADGLRRLGYNAVLALREPSMGPVFGMKGGATGGGRAALTPADQINLHFTGDFAAIAEANNLLAAMVDNALHFGTVPLDPRTVSIRRALDVNDRALRAIVTGLGGRTGGVPRETGFAITAASQVMATFCMATSLSDLKRRLGAIVVGNTYDGAAVTANDLGAAGAMTAILRDALAPNLVQTLEGTPAFVHGGPFANIAHGCNSVIATQAARRLGDIAITEAGFGADLGAEKFFDVMGRQAGIAPDLTVVVATVRALKYHGGVALADLEVPDVERVRAGMPNLLRHVRNLQEVFGQHVIVAINQFAADTDEEIRAVAEAMRGLGVAVATSSHFADGGAGAIKLAHAVVAGLSEPSRTSYAYDGGLSLEEKANAVVQRVYGGERAVFSAAALRELQRLEAAGWGSAPVCIAKTQYSFSTDANQLGAPSGFDVPIREVRLSAGAGFVVLVAGSIMTMPGLPRHPAAVDISVDSEGVITGMH
jgi:formate--tetrahydrofolate ligase